MNQIEQAPGKQSAGLGRDGVHAVLPPSGHHPGVLRNPADLAAKPLFSEPIRGINGVLNDEVRGRVRRVVLICGESNLSLPVLETALLAQVIPRNFPNASFVDSSGLMPLVKRPRGSELVLSRASFFSLGKFLPESSGASVTLHPYLGLTVFDSYEADALNRISNLTLSLPDFGTKGVGVVQSIQPSGINQFVLESGFHHGALAIQQIQARMLGRMGLEGLPADGERLILTPDQFSDELNAQITRLDEKLGVSSTGKPLFFINTAKVAEPYHNMGDRMLHDLEWLSKERNSIMVVNMGPPGEGNDVLFQQSMRLHSRLSRVRNRRAELVDVGRTDRLTMAALLYLAKKSNGCLIDVLGGLSFMAHWMDVPEVMLPIHTWMHWVSPRDNLEMLPEGKVKGNLIPAVEKVTGL